MVQWKLSMWAFSLDLNELWKLLLTRVALSMAMNANLPCLDRVFTL